MPENTPQWYALYTRSRHEGVVHKGLEENGFEVFLPLVERIRKWKDRKKKVKFPLFPGYLFVRVALEHETMIKILQQVGVVRFLGIKPLEPMPISESEIEYLKKLVTGSYEIDPYPFLKEGIRVRVKHGALAGLEGFLVKKTAKHLLVISVDVLREGVALTIDASDIEAIGETSNKTNDH
ncbi:MAG: UpxY family transcription antiterminator [Deltaproteobacteria bacterium]|nr:UpxY family transcription antiterminator [Deltaproteobacteria bacterium]